MVQLSSLGLLDFGGEVLLKSVGLVVPFEPSTGLLGCYGKQILTSGCSIAARLRVV